MFAMCIFFILFYFFSSTAAVSTVRKYKVSRKATNINVQLVVTEIYQHAYYLNGREELSLS